MSESQPLKTPGSAGTPLPPGFQRRRELRQQRRAERWRNLWRLVVFSLISAGLGYGLLRQGWILRGPTQVEVVGSRLVSRDQVIAAADLHFPQPLLSLSPRQLKTELAQALPVEQVRVMRLILPPRLRIDLVDREAVARAERRSAAGLEQGYIDRRGSWITANQASLIANPRSQELLVTGWNERHRPALATLLDNRSALGPGLRQIRFEADGSIWLSTAELGEMRMGPVDAKLRRRLEVAAHLIETLPNQLKGRRFQLIDLSDPEQPELSLPGPLVEANDGGPAQARKPLGAQ
ncbi:MAG: FtsQ-type POTRA domain-containing protein [Cyanobium sp.]